MMQKIHFASLLYFILSIATKSYAEERIPFIQQSIQGTWVITKFESTSIVEGELLKKQDIPESKKRYPKLTFSSNNRFIAQDMLFSFPDGTARTFSFSGQFSLNDSTRIMRLSFNDPTDNQPLQLFFKVEVSEEGIELLVNKEELFMYMDFISSKDSFASTLNDLFKTSVQSYSSHYFLKKSYQ